MRAHPADDMRAYPPESLRDFVQAILDRVELDPEEETIRLCYRIPLRSGICWRPQEDRRTHRNGRFTPGSRGSLPPGSDVTVGDP